MSKYARTPPPRQLSSSETLESLTHWETTFRTFYKKDETYKIFFKKDHCEWDSSQDHYGLSDEVGGETRGKAELAEDLEDLLNTLAGYLPYSYLTDKLLKYTKGWKDVYKIIRDHYNVKVSSETLLDFESIHKNSEETHRQFFERLLQHTKQHLAPAEAKVEDFKNTAKDKMTISLMNMVALQWLRKTSPDLIEIVKTEYSTELRSDIQLADLVPRIAPNIDALLKRYDKGVTSNKVETVDTLRLSTYGRSSGSNNTGQRGGRYASGNGRSTQRGRGGRSGLSRASGPFCPGCYYLSQQLGATIHFRHTPGDCPRKAVTVKMFEMEDNEHFEDDVVDDDVIVGKPEHVEVVTTVQKMPFQISKTDSPGQYESKEESVLIPESLNIPNFIKEDSALNAHSKVRIISDSKMTEDSVSDLILKVQKLETRQHIWSTNGVRKAKSPCVPAILENVDVHVTVDEGSEINCLDEGFAARNNIQFCPTGCKATAAGSVAMRLAGQTSNDINISIKHSGQPIIWNLGRMVVVKNLGVDFLAGEPAKVDNEIVTIPHKRLIEMKNVAGKKVKLPYVSKNEKSNPSIFRCRASCSEVIYPGGKLKLKLPIRLKQEKAVYVSPKQPNQHAWLTPRIYSVTDEGFVEINNETSSPVKLAKLEHFADVYCCIEVDLENCKPDIILKKIFDLNRNDFSHLTPHAPSEEKSEDYLHEISIDPDSILTDEWKQRFKKICEEFSQVITPRPGKYNGFYGNIDNSINFSSTPPPSIKAHLPKYSYDMMKIMGEKMDKLEEWGVLVKPEDIGVTPEFILPSMLMPKSEKDEWRLVTDFTALNIHIKKLETVAPTIKEAKEKLAKYKYHIQLDLSNYYYQGGMKIEDCQYLATPHPFKGLRVYQCEPQGLKNAGEHAYERLALIYGDLCAEEKMTRMADGLYILGDTLNELEENFREVLQRAELCGLTFKPSKIIITPKVTTLFGWRKNGDGWMPTSHTTSPLLKAPPPTTVKQTRSWIGSYKQLAECIPQYAVLLGPLEDVVSSRSSAERVVWTDELLEAFEKCKKSLNDINTIHVPKPSDTLHTFSDFSKSAKAIGGRLEIHRNVDGKIIAATPRGHSLNRSSTSMGTKCFPAATSVGKRRTLVPKTMIFNGD